MKPRLLIPLACLWLLTSCLHVQEAATPSHVKDVIAAGDLPLVSGATAQALISGSKVPVVVMFTADWCSSCKQVKPDFWRTVRRNEKKFLGILVDADKNKEFYEAQGAPALPAFTVFERGKARWRVTGTELFPSMADVLRENASGYDHGLTASTARKDPARLKVFLVAANADVANFVQEVHDLHAVWRARGLKEDEIACYWSVPNFGQYWRDRAQFQKVKGFASRCQSADLAVIEKDWRAAAAAKPDFMFLYVTAHGLGAEQAGALKQMAGRGKALPDKALKTEACAQFFSPHVVFDTQTYPKGSADVGAVTADAFIDRMHESCDGKPARMTLLTQNVMQRMLLEARSVPTVAVVQACHAGAVIPKTLASKATVLAAAAPERSSFGCDEEGDYTFYGQAFINALRARSFDPKDPQQWEAVHDTVVKDVEQRERDLGLKAHQRSEPMIVQGSFR